MRELLNASCVWIFLLTHFSCVHKEINIKEIYFKKESGITETEKLWEVKRIEQCSPREPRNFSEEIMHNIDINHIQTLLEKAFIQSKQKSWFNVEIDRVGKTCTVLEGMYHED